MDLIMHCGRIKLLKVQNQKHIFYLVICFFSNSTKLSSSFKLQTSNVLGVGFVPCCSKKINETTLINSLPKNNELVNVHQDKGQSMFNGFFVGFQPAKPIKPLKRTTFIQDDRLLLKFHNI